MHTRESGRRKSADAINDGRIVVADAGSVQPWRNWPFAQRRFRCLLLLTVAKARKIHVDGVRFQGMRYIDPTLAAYVGESVVLRYDPRDMAEVRLFHRNKFLCRAICPELAGQTVSARRWTCSGVAVDRRYLG